MNYFEFNNLNLPVRKTSEVLVNILFDDEGCSQAENLSFGWASLRDKAPSLDTGYISYNKLLRGEFPVRNKAFKNCAFTCVDFSYLDFENCTFNNCYFECCRFKCASFDHSNVTECMFVNCAFGENEIYSSNFLYDTFRTCSVTNVFTGPFTSFKDSIFDCGTFVESVLLNQVSNKPIVLDQLPQNVELYGWKGAKIEVGSRVIWGIVKLKIPKEACRVSPSGAEKCRCSKAKVIGIESLSGKTQYKNVVCTSYYDNSYHYKLGDTLVPKKNTIGDDVVGEYDPNQFTTCSKGIHFFLNREAAVRWVNTMKAIENRKKNK